MSVSYKRLWKLLIDKEIRNGELYGAERKIYLKGFDYHVKNSKKRLKSQQRQRLKFLEKEIDEAVADILEPTETIADAEPTESTSAPKVQPEKPKRQRRGNLTFKSLNIPIYAELLFKGKEEYKVTVTDDQRRTVSNLANELAISVLGRKESERVRVLHLQRSETHNVKTSQRPGQRSRIRQNCKNPNSQKANTPHKMLGRVSSLVF